MTRGSIDEYQLTLIMASSGSLRSECNYELRVCTCMNDRHCRETCPVHGNVRVQLHSSRDQRVALSSCFLLSRFRLLSRKHRTESSCEAITSRARLPILFPTLFQRHHGTVCIFYTPFACICSNKLSKIWKRRFSLADTVSWMLRCDGRNSLSLWRHFRASERTKRVDES